MEGIAGEVAVVTGAAQGNGRAIAIGLARAGARVICSDIQDEATQAVAAEILAEGNSAAALRVDVAQAASCEALAFATQERFGPTTILVNNAGIIRRTSLDSESFPLDWDAVMSINATGTMHMVRAFLSQLRQTGGRIVNLGSVMSVSAGPNLAAYAASKGAVLQLTRALASELADSGIRVNAIAPGVIETPMTSATRGNPEAIARFMAHTPMKRPGQPGELVGPVLFLASNASSYVTGALLPVDGGYLTS